MPTPYRAEYIIEGNLSQPQLEENYHGKEARNTPRHWRIRNEKSYQS